MDDLPAVDPDALEACSLYGGHVRIAGHEVDCFACQVAGPYSAADGSVVYVAPVARHHHQGTSDASPKELQMCEECWGKDEPTAMVARELLAAEVRREVTHDDWP